MEAFDARVRACVFRHLVETATGPTPHDVARVLGAGVAEVEASFRRLAEAHRIVLEEQRVVMAHPFSGVPTRHRATIGDMTWHANCGWDALAILALLGDGLAEATSAVDGQITRWHVREGVAAQRGLVHFVVPARAFWDDIFFT
jgi:hypothetical protein